MIHSMARKWVTSKDRVHTWMILADPLYGLSNLNKNDNSVPPA